MKQVQLYETIDGERFKSLKQAVRHEDMVKDVRKLNGKILPKNLILAISRMVKDICNTLKRK